MSEFDACLAFTLAEEGGYQCDPTDDGNWSTGHCNLGTLVGTCHGIAAPTLATWLGPGRIGELNPAMMQALPRDIAASILGAQYWLPCAGPQLPLGVDLMVFDHAVNCGAHSSVRLLQAALGVAADGFVGPVTLSAAHKAGAAGIIDFLARLQGQHYRSLNRPQFLTGWLGRLERRQAAAHRLTQGGLP